MKILIAGLLLTHSATAGAQQGFYLPPSSPSYGQDEFRASDGTSCRSSMDGAKRIEAGAYGAGVRNDERAPVIVNNFSRNSESGVGVYVRFSMSLDAQSPRIDCNKLFQIELQKKQMELDMMMQSLKAAEAKLEALQSQPDVPPRDTPPD